MKTIARFFRWLADRFDPPRASTQGSGGPGPNPPPPER